MSDVITKKDLENSLNRQTDEIMNVLKTFMLQVDEKFNRVEKDIADIKNLLIA